MDTSSGLQLCMASESKIIFEQNPAIHLAILIFAWKAEPFRQDDSPMMPFPPEGDLAEESLFHRKMTADH